MRILIVDDERGIREALKEMLEDEGFEVFTLESGSGVVDKVKELHPRVLILDLFLPGTSGMEVLKELNREGLTGQVAVIILSGHGTVESAVKAMKLGAFDFLEKPFDFGALLEAIKRAASAKAPAHNGPLLEHYTSLPLRQAREAFEKQYILEVLRKFNWDLKKSAQFMEIDISNLYRKMNKYGIEKGEVAEE
ncbi:response regulator [Thermovibrio ammonificans]|uniref:Two component transcriptional regulator, Fis family n=1 Tax=Thermovibrio ammonificans (strain DSM 15698 / JCM 12110 / HB-1) TaxID=648996 RepID=E8T265_THEA1|nr:response regulator [Thermovibrio ammonificans]ADU96960.1 two component transcriptional regulator, Fis family [Thermovibrio ammonificans HB-1]